MATVIFYEKPGCAGNARQKTVLEASGHTVLTRDILKTAWTRQQLLSFLNPLPISDWFNRNAPLVKNGAINPDSFDAFDVATVLDMLIGNPLLIRRPLLDVDGVRRAGFDIQAIHAWIGLPAAMLADPSPDRLETCLHGHDDHRCEAPA